MTTGKALDGKPYAGNPHVRFDEGEVASAATPRRGSLLYKQIILTIGVAMFAAASFAETRVWKTTDRVNDWDWTEDRNFEGGVAPSAGDVVKIPDGMTVTVSSDATASWERASSLDRIAPQGSGSTIIFQVAEGVTNSFGAGISLDATYISRVGTVEKTGKGVVCFTKNTSSFYDFRVGLFHVREGMVDFSKRASDTQEYFLKIRVEEGAVFKMPNAITWVDELLGEGLLTCSSDYQLRIIGGTAASPTVIGPCLANMNLNTPGYVRLLRADNRMWVFGAYDGITEFIDIGTRYQPSTTGNNGSINFDSSNSIGGTMRYIGDEDIATDKNVYIVNNGSTGSGKGVFDAGPHGGISFNAAWGWTTKSWGRPHMLGCFILKGSNTVPCRINGKIGLGATSDNLPGTLGIAKSGSGAWYLSNISNFFSSAIHVDEGELGFTSIKEKGELCALGTADDLKDVSQPGNYDTAADVAYAIRLGSMAKSYPADGLATFAYRGEGEASCRTRPLVLGGDARLLNASGKAFRFSGISAISNGVQNLVLGGDGTNDEIQNLTDGSDDRRLGVIKEGEGTWTLAMTNTFSGPVVVKGGTLKVRRDRQYTWYKLVVKDLWTREAGQNDAFKIGRWGLFDENGHRQNIGCVANGTLPVGQTLQPGEIGAAVPALWWMPRTTCIAEMTAAGEAADSSCLFYSQSKRTIDPDKEATWPAFELRLTNGTPEIAYYDIAVIYGKGNTSTGNLSNYNMRAWSLLGSTDGWNWDELHSVADSKSDDPNQILTLPTSGRYWMGQKVTTKGQTSATIHDTAKLQRIRSGLLNPPPMPLANVEAVTVENGAVLEAEGDITLSSFRVAADGTAGTVKGFALAPDCTLDVTGLPAIPESFDVPIDFEGVSPAAANWSLKVDGVPSTKYGLAVAGGKLRFLVKGMKIIIR